MFDFYQFFLNVDDDAVEELLLKMTLLPWDEIAAAMKRHADNPGERYAHRLLARAVTALVHGESEAASAERVSQLLFGSEVPGEDDWVMIADSAPSQTVHSGDAILDVLVSTSLASSKREAREYISGNAITLNGNAVTEDRPLNASDFQNGHALLKRGKRSVAVIRLQL
jgi:tyrosyl-tRNA synthetase